MNCKLSILREWHNSKSVLRPRMRPIGVNPIHFARENVRQLAHVFFAESLTVGSVSYSTWIRMSQESENQRTQGSNQTVTYVKNQAQLNSPRKITLTVPLLRIKVTKVSG